MEQEKIVKNKSAYILFCLDERPVVKKDNPDIKNRDILVELGKRWKLHKDEGTDGSERFKSYQVRAEEDKKRYLSEKGDSVQVKVVKEKVVKEKVVKEKVVKEKKSRKSSAKVVETAPAPTSTPEPVPEPVPAPVAPVVVEPVVEPVVAPVADKKASKRTSKKQK
jgi:hypothetical protein